MAAMKMCPRAVGYKPIYLLIFFNLIIIFLGTSSGFKPGTNELVMNELKSVLKQESFYDKASSSSFFVSKSC